MNDYTELKDKIYQFGARAVDLFKEEDVAALTPGRVDNYLTLISGYSALLEEEYGALELEKARAWSTFRLNYKSNVDTDRAWDGTEEGLRMIELKYLIKGTDKIISACKNRLRRLENEAHNRY